MPLKAKVNQWLLKLNASTDPAGLGIARFFFGLLMIIDIFDERGLSRLPIKYGDPDSCYFPLFNSLPRLSVEYMHLVYFFLLLSAVFIMLGFLYKISCVCFMACYWYIFLLDKTVWNNHSYLYGLLSILLMMCNANYYWSMDGLLWPSIRNKYVPFWQYGMLRFQLFLLYFYAGLKKLDREWLHGYSMTGLSRYWVFDPFRLFLSNDDIDYYIVHLCGLTLDISSGFLLLFDRTRKIALFFLYQFHAMNAIMFNIGMFSYMCMAMIPIFFRPDWPKVYIRKCPNIMQLFLPIAKEKCETNTECSDVLVYVKETKDPKRVHKPWNWSYWKSLKFTFIIFYAMVQLVLPYSHSITKGYNSWTQGLYGYSWDMMVHSWSTQHVVVKVVDEENNNTQYLRPGAFFPFGNSKNRVFSHPDMVKQYADCLAERIRDMPELNITKPQVYVDVWKSMNQRYQQRMYDPNVDIVKAAWSPYTETTWLKPLLVELSSWRETLRKIREINFEANNATEDVFVADFPGLSLENYIAQEIRANITVLQGRIIVQSENGTNTTINVNETLTLQSDSTHSVHTITEEPSCYMYVFYNTTWVEKSEEEVIASDPELSAEKKRKDEWKNMTALQKFNSFVTLKAYNFEQGIRNLYFFLGALFNEENDSNKGVLSDEL